jgi:phosphotriesterase-related protein
MLTDLVQTVTGSIPAEKLGVTITHEHIICDWSLCRGNKNKTLKLPWGSYMWYDDINEMTEELLLFNKDGGNSIVEVTCHGWGRDPLALKEISERSGVNIIASSGFYIESCTPEWIEHKPIDYLAKWITREIKEGCNTRMGNTVTNVKAGIIKTSVSRPHYSHYELKGLKAVAKAQLMTGAPITSHNSGSIRFELLYGNIGQELLDILEDHGVDPEAVIVGHTDENPDIRHLAALAKRNAWVQFDTVGKEGYILDETRADLIKKMKEKGFIKKMLLGHDQNRKPNMRKYGGPGYSDILNRLTKILLEKGLSKEDLETILIKNPAKALRIREGTN